MPTGLERFHQSGQSHFITFTCYHRLSHLSPSVCDICVEALERSRGSYGFLVYGYVFMPNHVHLLMSEPKRGTIANAVQSFKIGTSKAAAERRLFHRAVVPLWQKRYYDRNVRDHKEFIEKLDYIHLNPPRAGLVAKAEDWKWSSWSHYLTGEIGIVQIESEWTATRRFREVNVLKAPH